MATVAIDARDAHAEPIRGWGRHARELIRHLPAALSPGIRLREIGGGGRGPEVVWEQVGLPLALRRDPPDLFHAPNCFLPLWRPCPGVVTIHDLAFERYPEDFSKRTGAKYRYFTPRAARSAERVICVSRFTADDVVARYGVDEAKIRVIPNAPALALGDGAAGDGVERPYILAVGDLREKKNLGRLVSAWQRAQLPHRLVLAGLGEMEVPEGVQLTGYVGDGRLDALMRGADLLVHPSLYEGFGLVLVEAMARGTPVAAARATALPETAGDAAVLFDPLDVDDIAAAIVRALGERESLTARGLARAAQFTWEATARATADVYGELLG
jgi:glycosyltransferase involved in cell wall biosynthesis